MLGQRRRRWTNIKPTLSQRLLFDGIRGNLRGRKRVVMHQAQARSTTPSLLHVVDHVKSIIMQMEHMSATTRYK